MAEYSRNGHRSRIRKNYIANGTNGMSDANLLELYLSTIIPRKDVKPISYDLLNKFGTLENVFSASETELAKVKGIGDTTAMVIKLYSEFCNRIDNANKGFTMTKASSRLEYGKKLFDGETKEKSVFITLDNQDDIAGTFVFDGYFGSKKEDRMIIVEKLLQTNSSECIFYHFVPNGNGKITEFDLKCGTDMRDFLMSIHTFILDWIIVGENGAISVATSKYNKRICL